MNQSSQRFPLPSTAVGQNSAFVCLAYCLKYCCCNVCLRGSFRTLCACACFFAMLCMNFFVNYNMGNYNYVYLRIVFFIFYF